MSIMYSCYLPKRGKALFYDLHDSHTGCTISGGFPPSRTKPCTSVFPDLPLQTYVPPLLGTLSTRRKLGVQTQPDHVRNKGADKCCNLQEQF